MHITSLKNERNDFRDVWNYIRTLKTFTLEQVSLETGIPVRQQLYKIIQSMKKQNMVEVVNGDILPRVYKAVNNFTDYAAADEEATPVEEQRRENAELVWSFIRNLKTFILRDIEKATGLSAVKQLPLVIGRMEATGLVRINRKTKPYQYSIIMSEPPLACPELRDAGRKRKRTGHDRMWSALKILKSFTATDLAMYSDVSKESAKVYTRKLHQAGYLERIDTRTGEVYHFNRKRDTGRVSPAIYSNGQVYDRNERKVVYSGTGANS